MDNNISEQTIPPVVKLISQVIQIGAPKFPTGVSIDFEFMCTHSNYYRDQIPNPDPEHDDDHQFVYGPWKIREFEKLKKYQIQLDSDQLESVLGDWKAGIIDYENWLIDIKHKADLHQIQMQYAARQSKVWWKRIFMSRDPIRRLSASGRSN